RFSRDWSSDVCSSDLYYLDKGTAKMFKLGFNGKEQILRFTKTGDIIGYRSILSKQPYGASATAMEDTEVCFIPEKFFIKVLEFRSEERRVGKECRSGW